MYNNLIPFPDIFRLFNFSVINQLYMSMQFPVSEIFDDSQLSCETYIVTRSKGHKLIRIISFHQTVTFVIVREKGRDLTQSCDKSPYTHRTIQKATWQHKNATKTLITQLLRTDLGRSVGVTAVTQLVWLNQFTSAKPSHSPQNWCNQSYMAK